MKKFILISAIILPLVSQMVAVAYMPPPPKHAGNVISTSSGIHHPPQAGNHIIIQTGNSVFMGTTPPKPRHNYVYKDFAAPRRFPSRSYYIPSYCMPERHFYTDTYNPFCNHYRPFGSNMYISF